MGQSALRSKRTQFDVGALLVFAPGVRKGIWLIFPSLDTEIGASALGAATQTNSETLAWVPGRVLFSW